MKTQYVFGHTENTEAYSSFMTLYINIIATWIFPPGTDLMTVQIHAWNENLSETCTYRQSTPQLPVNISLYHATTYSSDSQRYFSISLGIA